MKSIQNDDDVVSDVIKIPQKNFFKNSSNSLNEFSQNKQTHKIEEFLVVLKSKLNQN
jgi:hypothetical protein